MREEDRIPTVAYWKGEPISIMSRLELEAEFVNAWVKIQELELRLSQLSVEHINDIAKLARR